MRNLLFLVAVLLILGYSVGVLPLSAANLVAMLIVLALIGILLAVLRRQHPG
jgi:hypothetical protein